MNYQALCHTSKRSGVSKLTLGNKYSCSINVKIMTRVKVSQI